MSLETELKNLDALIIRQRRELVELFGYETRNKYSIESPDGQTIGFAAEQQKGILGFLLRQFLGHWRKYDIHVFNAQKEQVLTAHHPFRFYFQRLEVVDKNGQTLGALEQRFSIFSKKFDVHNANGSVILSVCSPLFKLWTFEFMRGEQRFALVKKQWGGLLKEAFIDADTFQVEFSSTELTQEERLLLVAAGIFIDMQYFERKAGNA